MRRRFGFLSLLLVAIVAGTYVSVGDGRQSHSSAAGSTHGAGAAGSTSTVTTGASSTTPVAPPPPALVVHAPGHAMASWKVVAEVNGQPAAWLARRGGVSLLRFEQALVHLTLHAGSSDGGTVGWRYGDKITSAEIHKLIAAFNGGFKLTYAGVGFMSNGHVAVSLKPGLASIVTYTDGTTNIGVWHAGVPSPGKPVFSVLQNQRLLVSGGRAAANVSTCVLACWGDTIGGITSVARSALGINSYGQLIWAAGEHLTPAGLASALIGAGAVRALELDINPDWVAGYLYLHHRSGPVPTQVLPGQLGIAGKLLEPYSRDFFAVVAN